MIHCPIYIYTLSDPITGQVRYVGKTVQKPLSRFFCHISVSKNSKKKDHCHCWIKSLLEGNQKPVMKVIEETFDVNRETFWINEYRLKGCDLTNFTNGGDKGNLGKKWKLSPEIKEKFKLRNLKKVYIWNLDGKLIDTFDSVDSASNYLKCHRNAIKRAIKQSKSYKNEYVFSFSETFPEFRKVKEVKKKIII